MNLDYLSFEQPIAELEAKIEELQLVGNDNELNIAEEVTKLREKSRKLTQSIYAKLTHLIISNVFFLTGRKCMVIVILAMIVQLLVALPD